MSDHLHPGAGGCGSEACTCKDVESLPRIEAPFDVPRTAFAAPLVNGIALCNADELLDVMELRQRACTELLRQSAMAQGLLAADDPAPTAGAISEAAEAAIERLLDTRPAAMMELAWSASLIAPTAMVAMPASWRIRSANGVWNMRPYTGFSCLLTWPDEQSIRSAPAALKALAISTASSGVMPPGTQSWAEIRTDMGRSSGQTARTARKISSG